MINPIYILILTFAGAQSMSLASPISTNFRTSEKQKLQIVNSNRIILPHQQKNKRPKRPKRRTSHSSSSIKSARATPISLKPVSPPPPSARTRKNFRSADWRRLQLPALAQIQREPTAYEVHSELPISATTLDHYQNQLSLASLFVSLNVQSQNRVEKKRTMGANAWRAQQEGANGLAPEGTQIRLLTTIKADARNYWSPYLIHYSDAPEVNTYSTSPAGREFKNFSVPKYFFGLNYNYILSSRSNLGISTLFYDSLGAADPSLSYSYTLPHAANDRELLYSKWTIAGALPVSRSSKDAKKIIGLTGKGQLVFKRNSFSTEINGSYSHHFYGESDPTDEYMAEFSSSAVPESLFGEYSSPDIAGQDVATLDVYEFSRETSRTTLAWSGDFSLSDKVTLGSGLGGNYSYLASSYSRWQSHVTYLRGTYKLDRISLSGNFSAVSDSTNTDSLSWPSELTTGISLTLTGWL